MEVNMNTSANGKVVELVDRYIAMWNETDAGRRRGLIAKIWADGASYLDPVLSGEGLDGIDAMVKAVHEKYPGHRFKRTGDVNAHHDRAQFAWELGPEGGPALVKGVDFATLSNEGGLKTVTGFFTELNIPPQPQ
jgi:SnoaL-like domain